MFGKVGHVAHMFGHMMWVNFQESAAIMAGTTIELDQESTGDKYVQSPVIHEVRTETRTITEHARSVGRQDN